MRALGIFSGAIALVEQQIDHRRHRRDALCAFGRTWRLERHIGFGNALLGAGDALFHRRVADQEGAGDLRHAQAGDDAQGQRDLLGRGQIGMAADEQQPEHIVAIVRAVQPLGQFAFRISQVGNLLVRRQLVVRLCLRTPSSAALRPTRISQAVGSRGGPFSGQLFRARRQASWKASSARSMSRK